MPATAISTQPTSAQRERRPELYCLIPPTLEEELLNTLRAHYAKRGVKVIVERRNGRPKNPSSRFGRHERALHLPRRLGALPRPARRFASELRMVQRMPPTGLDFADAQLLDVVGAARVGDDVAASELVWRLNVRVQHRLEQRLGELPAPSHIEPALGSVLDRIREADFRHEEDFLDWLDGVVDAA